MKWRAFFKYVVLKLSGFQISRCNVLSGTTQDGSCSKENHNVMGGWGFGKVLEKLKNKIKV